MKPNAFIHAMNNAHVMFQFISDTEETARSSVQLFIQKLVNNGVIHSPGGDTEVDIGVDDIDGMLLSRVWIWVPLDKLTALHTFAAQIPSKVS